MSGECGELRGREYAQMRRMRREGKGMRYRYGMGWVYDAGRRVGLLLFAVLHSVLSRTCHTCHTNTLLTAVGAVSQSVPFPSPSHTVRTVPTDPSSPPHKKHIKKHLQHPNLSPIDPSPPITIRNTRNTAQTRSSLSLGVHGKIETSHPVQEPVLDGHPWRGYVTACMVLYSTWVGGLHNHLTRG
jgi:hypothetical protein